MVWGRCPCALIWVLVLALGVAGCGSSSDSSPTPTSPTATPTPTPTPTTTTASLTGTVSTSSGEGMSGATVTVLDGPEAGASVATNSSGAYTFDSLTTGNVNFKATAAFYRDSSGGVFIDGTNTLNFTLARSLVPLGGSVDSVGGRLVGATVTILDGLNAGETAVTNENGDYRFAELASGNVNFTATATGYDEDRKGILVNGTDSLNFTLTLVPTLTITSVIVSGGPGTAIQDWEFTVTTNQTFASYNWDFGDGQTLTGAGAVQQHRYFRSQGEARTVSITAVRADGSTLDATLDIAIE